MTANERKSVVRATNLRNVRPFGRTTASVPGIASGSAAAVTLGRRDWDELIDALRSAARYLNDPPDPVLLRIANDIEKKLPGHGKPK